MATKNHIYLDEWRRNYKLNYSAIVQEFIDKWILDKSFSQKAGSPKFKDIFVFLNNNRDKFVDEEIILDIELDNEILNDDFFNARLLDRIQLNLEWISNEKNDESSEWFKSMKTIYVIMKNIDIAIDRAFSARAMVWSRNLYDIRFDDTALMAFYKAVKRIFDGRNISNKDLHSMDNLFILDRYDFSHIDKKLNEIVLSKSIKIQINTKFFITKFLEKIDVFSEYKSEEEKSNIQFIDKFTATRNQKELLAEKYYRYWMYSIWVLLTINIVLYIYNFWNTLSFDSFLQRFLWSWVYILFIEILVITIGAYCFKLYNFYSKMVELYDSHIGLIESDLHYKNDEQLINGWDEALFELRKENTQKIHSLPDKALDLLSLKWDMKTSSDFSIKIIEKLIDKIK